MSLILITPNDITAGEPSPCALYDQDHSLLLKQGDLVRDNVHLKSLLDRGAYRELSWDATDSENDVGSFDDAVTHGKAGADEIGKRFTFNDMNLKVGDRLQIQPPEYLTSERFPVGVVGYIRDVSLLVTTITSSWFFNET